MTSTETYNILKEKYLDKGLKIFPVTENNKQPLIPVWQIDCSNSVLQVLYWLKNTNNCNWGLPCTPNNLFVLDIDVHNINGLESLKKLLNELKITELNTLSQRTPSGGLHLIFKSDDELKTVANTANSFPDYPGIDIRSDGYILCYPSSINGVEYTFNNISVINEMPLALKEFILSQKNLIKTERKHDGDYEKPEIVEEGGRDVALFEYINNLYFKTRLEMDEIEVLANYFNEHVCDPPLPKRQVSYKIKKVFKKDRGKVLFLKLNEYEGEDEDENE